MTTRTVASAQQKSETARPLAGPGVLAVFVAVAAAVMHPPLWAVTDDANILGQATGPAALFQTYSGYLAVIQRAVSLIEGPDPLLIGALASYVAIGLVAWFLAVRVHPVAVVALVLAPATNVYGTLSDIQWICAVYLIGMLVATPPTSARGRMLDGVGIFLCGLTGPFAILLLPLYAVRAIKPVWRWHLLILGAAAVIQLVALSLTYRPPAPEHDIAAVMLARAALPLVLIALTGLWLPRRWAAGTLYVALAVTVLGIMGTLETTAGLLAGAGERYFYLPWVLAIGMAALAVLQVHDSDGVVLDRRARRAAEADERSVEWAGRVGVRR